MDGSRSTGSWVSALEAAAARVAAAVGGRRRRRREAGEAGRPGRAAFAGEPLESRMLLNSPGTAWTLTFDDEFTGTAVDYTKWADYLPWNSSATGDNRYEGGDYANYMVNHDTVVNGQTLTSNVSVSDGQLHLKTQQTSAFTVGSKTFNYTGTMLTTGRSPYRSFSSGYFEIRARLPQGAGNWPAFWMTNGWPPEDDIMEFWPAQPRSHQGLYGMDSAWHDYNATTSSTVPSTNWHTFAMEWGPGYQKFFIDDQLKYSTSGSFVPGASNPQYLLLNSSVTSLQTSGYSNANDNTLDVDYVRVYSYNAAAGPVVTNSGWNANGTGWTYTTAAAFPVNGGTIGHTGTGDLHIEGAGEANQTITGLSPNTTYTLSGWAVVGTGTTTGLFGVRNFSGGAGNVSVAAGNSASVGSWVQSAVTFTTGPSDTSAVIYCSNPNTNNVYFDDLALSTPVQLGTIADSGTAVSTPRNVTVPATQGQSGGFWDFAATSSNTAVVANTGFTYSGSGGSRTLNVTPQAGATGTTVITVTATDSLGATSTRTFNFTVGATTNPGTPTVATAAAASPTPVAGTTANLSVLGADDAGEAGLTYTWWVGSKPAGAADPTFSANGTNAAKTAVATFSMAGTYRFGVQITDASGNWTTSAVDVTVAATPTTVTLSPATPMLGASTTQQFSATVADQFGALISGPSLTWAVVSGGGTINSAGLYTAPAASGSATVQATSGAASGTAAVTVVPVAEELAWYLCDETSGPVLDDNSGHNKPATLAGSYSFGAGPSGNALNLTGGYADAPDGLMTTATDFSISTWVKLTSLSTWSRIFDFGTGQSVNMFLTPQAGTINLPRFAITTSGGSGEQRIDSNTAIAVNAWTHVAVTLSGTTGTLYINGVAVGTNSAMTLNPSSLGTTTNNYIGKSQYPDPALQGSIDDFRVYGRALSASEVQSLAGVAPNAAPTVATPASASPNPVTGTTTNLSVVGADDAGEPALTYTWTATGPAAVTYSANGTNAAKNATATFSAAGTYTFTATITDAGGLTATSSATVTVNQTLTSITVSPATASVNTNATQQFTATAKDQFGTTLSTQPTFTWTVTSGGGTVSSSGLYTAPATAGSATVQAASGAVTGTASVTVVAAQPPAAPSNLTVAKTGRNKAKLTWHDNASDETGFHVWSSRDGITWTLLSTVAAATGTGGNVSYTTGALSTGTWFFKVTSYNANGDSSDSNVVSLVI